MTDAGFVGLGIMGSALSGHLIAAGWAVTGYDIDPARMAEHERRGGLLAASPAGTTVHAEVIAGFARDTGSPVPLSGVAPVSGVAPALLPDRAGPGPGDEDAACIHAVLRELPGS